MRLVNGNYQQITPVEVKSFDNLRLHSDVLDLDLCLISGELRFQNPQSGEFLLTHKEENSARVQGEFALKNVADRLLNSGFAVERVAEMIQLSVEKVRLLLEE